MKNQVANKMFEKEIKLRDNEIRKLKVELNNTMKYSLSLKDFITPLINLHFYNNILNKHPDDIPDDILIDCITSLYRIVQIPWAIPSTKSFLKNIFTKCYELLLSRGMTSKFEKELDILSCTLILP